MTAYRFFGSLSAMKASGVIAWLLVAFSLASQATAQQSREEAEARAEYEARWGSMFYTTKDPNPPKRDLPDYDTDGGEDGVTAGEVALWVPQFLLLPVYYVTDQWIRRPLGAGVTRAEEKEIPTKIMDAFRFGKKRTITVVPILQIDLGLRTNIGVITSFGDIPAKNATLSASAFFGGVNFVNGDIAIGWAPPKKDWLLGVGFSAARRADGLFYGLGSEVSLDNESNFRWKGYDVAATYDWTPWRRSQLSFATGYRFREFGDALSGDTSIPDVLARGGISSLPPGYPEGYSAWFLNSRITIDTRKPRPDPGSGVRFVGGANVGVDPKRGDTNNAWIVYGAAIRGYWDVSGHQHTLSLAPVVVFSDAFRGETPFTELPAISGQGPMPGFVARYLAGDSAFALNFNFTWPIWLRLDGKIHFAVGNVYDGHLAGFSADNLRMSVGGGITAIGSEKTYFEFMVGGGTDTFAQGAKFSAVRFVFGVTRDY